MDWFLYDNGLRHERVKNIKTFKSDQCSHFIPPETWLTSHVGKETKTQQYNIDSKINTETNTACSEFEEKTYCRSFLSQTRPVYLFPNLPAEALIRRCSGKKVFLEISQNSQENTCARDPFLIKLQAKAI